MTPRIRVWKGSGFRYAWRVSVPDEGVYAFTAWATARDFAFRLVTP